MTEDRTEHWRDIVARLGRPDGDSEEIFDALDELQAQLQNELFGSARWPLERPANVDPQDPRLQVLFDALAALALLAPDDPAYPWERGWLLAIFGRHLEAAEDYLAAVRLFELDATAGTGLTGDERDWSKSALFHAAKNLVLGGQPAAAAAILPRLDADDRAEVEPLISAKASGTIL